MRSLRVDRRSLEQAAGSVGIDAAHTAALWDALRPADSPGDGQGEERFDGAHVAFYVGGLIVLVAMTWFMGEAWDEAGVGAALAIAVGYAAAFALLSVLLLRRGWWVPGGLLATVVVALVPLIVYAFQRVAGLWPDGELGEYGDFYDYVAGGWFPMEVATAVAALVALRLVGFPFLVMPLAFVAWFASMDVTEVVFGADASDDARAGVSICVGTLLLGGGMLLDRRRMRAHAFWLHLFGLLCVAGAFCWWGGDTGEGWPWLAQGALGAIGIATAVALRRRVYLVFGGLGVLACLTYLASEVFEDSLLFPLVVALGGLAVIAGGMALARRGAFAPA